MRKLLMLSWIVALFIAGFSCSKAPTESDALQGAGLSVVDYQEQSFPVTISYDELQRVREEARSDESRARVNIKPAWPNPIQWPVNNIPPGFIAIQLDGITGQHIYYIHESVVPDEGVTFSIIEEVYYLDDGSVVAGLEFTPHGTIFSDHTYLYWDFSYLYDDPPEELDLLYWAGEEENQWLVDLHRDLTPRERRRVEFTIDHFSIYAIRRSTLPKPPPPSMSFVY